MENFYEDIEELHKYLYTFICYSMIEGLAFVATFFFLLLIIILLNKFEMKSQISLILDEEGKTYTTGDTISGVVRLDVIDGIDVQDIVVSFYGIAKARNARAVRTDSGFDNSRNTNDYHTEYHYQTNEQTLLNIPIRLFPNVAQSSTFLENGVYEYPFSVVIPFANGAGIGALPPSFLYERGTDDYSQVIYEVSAIVKTPQFYRSNLTRYQHIKFAPPNATLVYDRAHILDSSGFLLSPMCGSVTRVKYEPIHLSTRSSWKRFFTSNSIKIPLELLINFGQEQNDDSARIIEINNNLALCCDISLLCPFNNDALRKILFTDEHNHDKGKRQIPEAWPDRASILITHIKITLQGTVTYTGAQQESHSYLNRVVVDRPLNHELELADFEPTQYYNSNNRHNIFDRVDSKMEHLIDNVTVYKLPLQSLWFDGFIGDDLTSSFLAPNIDNRYNLGISLTIRSKPGDRKDTLRWHSNVVMLRNEGSLQQFQPPLGPPPSQLISQQPLLTQPDLTQPPPPYQE